VGTYTVVVEKEKYKAVDKSFESKKKLYISFSPRSPKVGEDVTLTVKDKDGNPVADALVSIDGGKSEATDASGVYVTKLIEVKTYTITASKESFMYWGSEEKLTVRGSLNLTLNPDAVEVGEEARIIVVDGMGKPITAELNVTKPDGLQQSLKDTSYIPDEPGNHTITASKDGYETAVKVFYVSTHSISLNYTIEKKMLTVAISSNGMPVQDINVKLINPYNDSSATDSNGLTYFTIQSAGDYVFEVNKEKIKKEYESKTVTEKIIKKRNTILLALPVIIVVSLAALAVFVVYQFKRRKKGRGTVRKKSGGEAPLERSEKSTLAKV
jgi:hypothetical protein